MKKILVTGGSGFLGRALVNRLRLQKYNIYVLDKKNNNKIKGIKYITGSIEDKKLVHKSLKGIDYVFHFASLAGIPDCNKNPASAVEINILGTLNVLEGARINKIKKIIFSSTIYSLSEQGGVYRSTKQCCEMLIENYYKLFSMNYIILRFGSLYGPRSNDFNFIKNAIDQAKREKKILRNGDGLEVRKYIYVDDAADASIKVLSNKYKNEYYEITGSRAITVKTLLSKIEHALGTNIKVIYNKHYRDKHDQHYYKNPNTFKLRKSKKLNFKNKINIEQGLKLTIANT